MSARDALRAAVELQRRFAERGDDELGFPLGVGIGLDAGEGVAVEGGLRSGALNLAARLCALAGPGQILASGTTVSLARKMAGIRFRSRGTERVKGFEDPVRVVEVLPDASAHPPAAQPASRWRSGRHLSRRTVGVVVLAIVVGLAAVGFVLLGERGGISGDGTTRVALVVGADPSDNSLAAQFSEGLLRAERAYDLETETLIIGDVAPTQLALNDLSKRLDHGDFDLVVWAGYGAAADALYGRVGESPNTRFVYVDAELDATGERQSNVTALRLNTESAAHLAGYLSGLMERDRSADASEPGTVSVVAGLPVPAVEELRRGFTAGARRAFPGVRVQTDYSQNFLEPAVCEKVANDQIDAGSHVVFNAAGECGTGALRAAGIRGAWGVGVDRDQSYLGRHILASVVKRFDHAVELAVRRFLDGSLPGGATVDLGIDDDVVGIVGFSPDIPAGIRKKVSLESARLRAQGAAQP